MSRVIHEARYGGWILRCVEWSDDGYAKPAWPDSDAVIIEIDAIIEGVVRPFACKLAGISLPLDPGHPVARERALSIGERTRGGAKRSRLTVRLVLDVLREARLLAILEGTRRVSAVAS